MENNLELELDEFKKMKRVDRDVIIFKNLITIRSKLGDDKFHKKIQYVWLTLLTGFCGVRRFFSF